MLFLIHPLSRKLYEATFLPRFHDAEWCKGSTPGFGLGRFRFESWLRSSGGGHFLLPLRIPHLSSPQLPPPAFLDAASSKARFLPPATIISMALRIHTAQATTRRDGGIACYGLSVSGTDVSEPAVHTEWGLCERGAKGDANAGANLAGLRAVLAGIEWYSANISKLPVGEQAVVYVDQAEAVSYIEQVRSRMLTGRRSPSKLEGGQRVDFTTTIRLRALLGKCRGLALSVYEPHDPREYQDALELAERSLVAELESSRGERAGEVELADLGKGLFRASGRYEVDALLVYCECKDFEITNAGRLGRYPVRCKHIFAAQQRLRMSGGPAAGVNRAAGREGGADYAGRTG